MWLDSVGCPSTWPMKDVLIDKYPPARVAAPESLLHSDDPSGPSYDPVLFDWLTG